MEKAGRWQTMCMKLLCSVSKIYGWNYIYYFSILFCAVAGWPVMVSDLDSETSAPDSSHCVVLFGKTRHSHSFLPACINGCRGI